MAFSTTAKIYESKGTSVPTITLGGTNVTSYTTQQCSYTVIGDRIFFDLEVKVLEKGPGTGELYIRTNIPFKYAATKSEVAGTIAVSATTNGSSNQHVWAEVIGGSTVLRIFETSNTVPEQQVPWLDTVIVTSSPDYTLLKVSGSWRISV